LELDAARIARAERHEAGIHQPDVLAPDPDDALRAIQLVEQALHLGFGNLDRIRSLAVDDVPDADQAPPAPRNDEQVPGAARDARAAVDRLSLDCEAELRLRRAVDDEARVARIDAAVGDAR